MNMLQAKTYFHLGGLKDPKIIPNISKGGWMIIFMYKDNEKYFPSVYNSKRSKGIKIFKDLKTAINIIKNIGFDNVKIINLQK